MHYERAPRFRRSKPDGSAASAAASIATGWSEPVPGRELHPLKSSAFSRRTLTPITIQAGELLWAVRALFWQPGKADRHVGSSLRIRGFDPCVQSVLLEPRGEPQPSSQSGVSARAGSAIGSGERTYSTASRVAGQSSGVLVGRGLCT